MATGWTSALAGLVFGLGLIVAIGAQNAHVLRQGLRREHVAVVVAVCALSDVVLIAVGTAGVGALVAASPVVTAVATLLGAAVLLVYGALAARRALHPGTLVADDDRPAGAAAPVVPVLLVTLALTWLNPHVYLDTVVLLGAVSAGHGDARWWFAAGAAVGSVAWFSALGFGAALLRPVFARPGAWRVLDAGVAAVMVAIAAGLVVDLVAGAH